VVSDYKELPCAVWAQLFASSMVTEISGADSEKLVRLAVSLSIRTPAESAASHQAKLSTSLHLPYFTHAALSMSS
jgi:hypothetical protein